MLTSARLGSETYAIFNGHYGVPSTHVPSICFDAPWNKGVSLWQRLPSYEVKLGNGLRVEIQILTHLGPSRQDACLWPMFSRLNDPAPIVQKPVLLLFKTG